MAAAALTENLYKAVRELRLVDPDPGPHGALNQARAQVAHTQMVIRNALTISDIMGIVFSLLRNPLDPRDAVAFGSTSPWLWAQKQIQELLLQLRAHQEDAAGLCHKLEMDGFSSKSCKNLREAKNVYWKYAPGMLLSEPDFKMLGQLSSALPALKVLRLSGPNSAAGCEGGQLLAEGLGVGALPELIRFGMRHVRFSDAGASLLAAALGQSALARLELLHLTSAGIGDAGLVALAPALRRLRSIVLNSRATLSATKVSPPSWRRRRWHFADPNFRARRSISPLPAGVWRSSSRSPHSPSASPWSLPPAARPWSLRSIAAHCQRSRSLN